MKNTSKEIIYSEIFNKWPILKKSYDHLQSILDNNELDLFSEYILVDQNGQISIYPIGVYDDKLIFITEDDKLEFPFDEISYNYAIKHMIKKEPENKLSSKELSKYYIRLFSITKANNYFEKINK